MPQELGYGQVECPSLSQKILQYLNLLMLTTTPPLMKSMNGVNLMNLQIVVA